MSPSLQLSASPSRFRVRRDTVVRVAHQLQLHNRPNCPIEPSTCCRICTPENSNGSPIQHDGSCSFLDPLRSPSSSPCCSCALSSMGHPIITTNAYPRRPSMKSFSYHNTAKPCFHKSFSYSRWLVRVFVIYTACVPCQQSGRLRRGSRSHSMDRKISRAMFSQYVNLIITLLREPAGRWKNFHSPWGSSENMVGVACISVKLLAHIYSPSLTAL